MIQVEKNDTLREISSQNVLWSTLLDQTGPKFQLLQHGLSPHLHLLVPVSPKAQITESSFQ